MFNRVLAAAVVAAFFAASHLALAQAPLPPTAVPNVELPVLITNASATVGTVSSAEQQNTYHKGVICTMNMSAHSNTPSTTVVIQGYDPIAAAYYTLGTSGAITADAAPTSLMIYPGIQTSSLATNMTGFGVHLPRHWRVQNVLAGTTPVVTSTTGCVLLN